MPTQASPKHPAQLSKPCLSRGRNVKFYEPNLREFNSLGAKNAQNQ